MEIETAEANNKFCDDDFSFDQDLPIQLFKSAVKLLF